MTGIELIEKERKSQIEHHGYDIEYDLLHNKLYQLGDAAAMLATSMVSDVRKRFSGMPRDWDDAACLHMCKKDRQQRLIIAGALIAAELDTILVYDSE